MEAGQECQGETAGTNVASVICEKADCIRYDADSEKVETSLGQSGMFLDQQTSAKQKKSPFKFFGGRKSICTLPSFFGGKHKGLSKGSSKKGLSKSKTHDGFSDVPREDGKKESSFQRFHMHEHTKFANSLPSSQSADSGITSPVKLDFNFHDSSPLGSTECFDKKLNGEKSLSFPRPKKGLKGLFSSIRRHKKNKAIDTEKSEISNNIPPSIILDKVTIKYTNEDSGSDKHNEGSVDPVPSENYLDAIHEKELTVECSENFSGVPQPTDLPSEANLDATVDQKSSFEFKTNSAVSASTEEVFLEVLNTDHTTRDSLSGGDQISLMLEDVSSLKSFDSLTGCGDIIADQDIDHMSDNTISLERNREITKRSSCLVTYQGGGEEMATPDDMEEEYLQQLLEDSTGAEANYELNQEKENEGNSKSFISLEASEFPLNVKDPFDRALMCNTELLTPQSDQQESAPNSDEGYYDSTTPGPEDDSGEGFIQKERLPRDSYSGDALYEFYEPDDNLMSPAPGGESLYESKTPCSEIFDQFFGFSIPADSGSIQEAERKRGATETEEERLAVIQKQLLFWERQREAALKEMEGPVADLFCKEKLNIECENRTANLVDRNMSCLGSNLALLQNTNKDAISKGIQNVQTENQSWTDFQENSFTHSKSQECYSQHLEGNCLIEDDAGFELNVDSLEAQDQDDTRISSSDNFKNFKIPSMHHVQNVFDNVYNTPNECEDTAEFNNGMLFSSISERLGKTGSSSSFHHNLDSLPTMVTFDIVDVENEGECEQQIELSPDEEDDTSFETFDHSYVQESLADCEEQLFQVDSHLPFHSYNWGVASLPRHLDHYKLIPSMPVPLSLNRRSKSLDTENMELELGGLHLSRAGLRSNDHSANWEDGPNHWSYGDACSQGGESAWDERNCLRQDIQPAGNFERCTSDVISKQGYSRNFKSPSLSKKLSQRIKPITRITNTTLQCNTKLSQEVSNSNQYYGENTTKKLALVLPLEEKRDLALHPSFCDPAVSIKQSKNKPVGITQAMPQQRKNAGGSLIPTGDYKEQFVPTKKGTVVQRATASDDWSNHLSECTNS
ncbi:APC membrane recruitment protein 1 [Pelobates fuscus]|uniref:APC membrane recruitment protein 1 n=1 Tax=Pelobates fuscus TaxID=191477 RepID=UPI002FE4A3BB